MRKVVCVELYDFDTSTEKEQKGEHYGLPY